MKRMFALAAGLALSCTPVCAFDGWRTLATTVIPGKTSAWDYITYDAKGDRLFIGHRKDGLQVFDIAAGRLVTTIAGTAEASSNGATLIPEFDLGVSSNENGALTPFKLSTLEAQAPIKLADELDFAHYDPVTKRLLVNVAAGKDGAELVVLQVPTLEKIGVVKVATKKPEHAEADGEGGLYLAARDLNTVYRIDMKALAVSAQWSTPGCAQTNNLAYDVASRRVLLGCRGDERTKPSFAVLDPASGKITYTSEIGGGVDGMVFDPASKRVFLAGGVGATLNVFEQTGADAYKPVETLGTRAGMRALAWDARRDRLYSVAAEGSADAGRKITTSVSPFYANTFFPDTFTVYTFGKR